MEVELIEGLCEFLRGLGFDVAGSSVYEVRVWEGVAFESLWVEVRPLVGEAVWELVPAYSSWVRTVGFEVPLEALAERIVGLMPRRGSESSLEYS